MAEWFLSLGNLGILTAIITLVAWIIREVFGYFLERERIRFSRLHNKRGEVISNLYSKITKVEMDMLSLTSPAEFSGEPTKQQKMRKAGESLNDLIEFSFMHRIYFGSEICTLLDNLEKKFKHIFIDFDSMRHYKDRDPRSSIKKDEIWMKSWNDTKNEIPKLKILLERQFRRILGVEK